MRRTLGVLLAFFVLWLTISGLGKTRSADASSPASFQRQTNSEQFSSLTQQQVQQLQQQYLQASRLNASYRARPHRA